MSPGSALTGSASAARRLAAAATAPARTGVALAVSLPLVARELGPLVRNLRLLTGDLHRLAGEDGDLARFLREAGELAARRADEAPRRSSARRTSSDRAGSRSTAARRRG